MIRALDEGGRVRVFDVVGDGDGGVVEARTVGPGLAADAGPERLRLDARQMTALARAMTAYAAFDRPAPDFRSGAHAWLVNGCSGGAYFVVAIPATAGPFHGAVDEGR